MKITIEHISGDRPQFNVALSSAEGREPFLTVKGCRLVDGKNGSFVSWPARKLDSGKYWQHVWGSEAFNAAVLAAVRDSEPPPPKKERQKDEAWRAMADDSMPPF